MAARNRFGTIACSDVVRNIATGAGVVLKRTCSHCREQKTLRGSTTRGGKFICAGCK